MVQSEGVDGALVAGAALGVAARGGKDVDDVVGAAVGRRADGVGALTGVGAALQPATMKRSSNADIRNVLTISGDRPFYYDDRCKSAKFFSAYSNVVGL